MKHVLSVIILLFPALLYAQVDADIDGTEKTSTYEFFKSVVAYPCDDPDCEDPDENNPLIIDLGSHGYKTISFAQHGVAEDDYVVIRILPFANEDLRRRYNYEYDEEANTSKTKYFAIKRKDFEEKSRKIYAVRPFAGGSAITGGVTVLPIKIRPRIPNSITGKNGGFDFSKDVTLGLTIGHKQRMSKRKPYFLNLLLCSGIGSVGLDSFNTEGTITSSADVPAWTIATGFVMDYKLIQFGVFVGWDHVSSKNRNNWIYQGNMWYSIGIGYSLFSVSSSQDQSAKKQ